MNHRPPSCQWWCLLSVSDQRCIAVLYVSTLGGVSTHVIRRIMHPVVLFAVSKLVVINQPVNQSINQLVNQSLTHSFTHPPTHSPTHPLTHSLTHSPTHSLTHSPTHSLTHSLNVLFYVCSQQGAIRKTFIRHHLLNLSQLL